MSVQSMLFVFAVLLLTSTNSFKLPSKLFSNPNLSLDKFKDSIKAKTIPAILGALLLVGNPSDSNALQSGSRSGGSSFRSSSSTRSFSSSPSRGSYAPSYGGSFAPSFIPIPRFYSPIPIYPSPVIVAPFSIFDTISNLVVIGGVIYLASRVISGSAFGNFGKSDEDSATVVKLNLALTADWSADGIIPVLSQIASNSGDMSSRAGLSNLLSETVLALIRRQVNWYAVSHEAKTFSDSSSVDTESYFQKLSIKERSKFDQETKPTKFQTVGNSFNAPSSSNLAIVSLVVALRGKNNPSYKSVRSLTDTREILQSLAADALTVSIQLFYFMYQNFGL